MIRDESGSLATGGKWAILAFVSYFVIIGVAPLQPGYTGFEGQESSLINQIMLSISYLFAFKSLLSHKGLIGWLLKNSIPFGILLVLVVVSVFWSKFPKTVLTTFIHNIGMYMVSAAVAAQMILRRKRFFNIALLFLFLYIVITVIVVYMRPDIGVMPARTEFDTTLAGRWRGLALHPNQFGAICVFIIWAACCAWLFTESNLTLKFLAVASLALSLFCLIKSNCVTSILIALADIIVMFWLSYIRLSRPQGKVIKISIFGVVLFLVLISAILLAPELVTEKFFFKLIGRDASFSGRTTIWEMGLKGFYAEPFLGWSFDGLNSFLASQHIGFGQLHNGYLDLLVRGGLVSMFFFFIWLFQIFFFLFKRFVDGGVEYIIGGALVVSTLVDNVTEASLLRNTNTMWLMFLLGYVYLLMYGFFHKDGRDNAF